MDKNISNFEESLFEDLKNVELGSEEYSRICDVILKMNKQKFDEERFDLELQSKEIERNLEKRDKIIKYSLDGLGIALPLIFYGIWFRQGLNFEKTGSFTSMTMRNLLSKFKFR